MSWGGKRQVRLLRQETSPQKAGHSSPEQREAGAAAADTRVGISQAVVGGPEGMSPSRKVTYKAGGGNTPVGRPRMA